MKIHPLLTVTAASLISCGVGAAVGYKLAERNLALRFEERLLRETESMREFYQHATETKKPFATPEEAAANLIKPGTILKETAVSLTSEPPAERVAYHKITHTYTPEDDVNDPEDKMALEIMFPENAVNVPAVNVFTDGPHVIDQDVFTENVTEWEQSTLTWYTVDNVLTDERDQVVEDVDGTVGTDNLQRFGEGSSDANIVHVRNTRLSLEFEVVRHEGSYRQSVLGIDEDPRRHPSGRG